MKPTSQAIKEFVAPFKGFYALADAYEAALRNCDEYAVESDNWHYWLDMANAIRKIWTH